MGTLHVALDQAEADKLLGMVRERIADVVSGAVTGFDWDKETELSELDNLQAILMNAGAEA